MRTQWPREATSGGYSLVEGPKTAANRHSFSRINAPSTTLAHALFSLGKQASGMIDRE
jgi:hypothetical protein